MSTSLVAPSRPVIWEPLAGSQTLALDSRADHTLYTGTRGPGKSEVQLMRYRRRVGIGYGAYWRGIIFDRQYKHLDDLVAKSKKIFHKFNDGAEWLASTNAYKWVWPTGEELLFRSIEHLEDYENYHGQEYPFIGWNELTKYPTGELYHMMMSCNRSSFMVEKDAPRDPKTGKPFADANGKYILPEIPLEVFSTCNSAGPGHGWVKDQFIDVAPYGKVVKVVIPSIFNPQTRQEEDIVRTQVALFGSYKENKYLSPAYIAGLVDSTKNNANLKSAWLDGSWDIVAGGAIDDVWDRSKHVVPRFQIPVSWKIDRSFDWGSSQPFSVGWWAEANGEEATLPNDEVFCPAAGSLIQIGEWYGTHKIGTNKGLKLGATDVAIGIRQREAQMLTDEYILKLPRPGPADNQISAVTNKDFETIEFQMAKKGVLWEKSDKSPGARINGLELIRGRLQAVKDQEGPGLYFMDNCRASISTLPILPRDEVQIDDVDTDSEDHPYDMVRYRVLKGASKYAPNIKVNFVN